MEGGLYLPMLPNTARQAYILPNIKHELNSNRSLCDAGFTFIFKITYVTGIYKSDIILQGWLNHNNKFWYFPLSVDNEDGQVGDNKKTQ